MRVFSLALLVGCGAAAVDGTLDTDSPLEETDGAEGGVVSAQVTVTLDGEPVHGAWVHVGGTSERWETDPSGQVVVQVRDDGRATVIAAHPDARIKGDFVDEGAVTLHLERFSHADNESYRFQDPGSPTHNADTRTCAHCHRTLNADWYESPHRRTASNPRVQDVYAGTVTALGSSTECEDAGGRWLLGIEPGTRDPLERCYLGAGVLPDLNDCGDTACDGLILGPDDRTGGCADCHAPGIDGELGGRDLLEATGIAFEAGVHCDVCHKVESVRPGESPGVAGWLKIVRPSEESLGLFDFEPLTFGPRSDVANPRMGAVPRDHFRDPAFCGGCHELQQEVLVPGASIDSQRWPGGRLPVHTTYSEWEAGRLSPEAPCVSCHMPPDPEVGNGADLGNIFEPYFGDGDISGGWPRPPGAVRQHSWIGPRSDELLDLAAAVEVETSSEEDGFEVTVTVRNVGAGHGLPTGEPLRSLVLLVQARCGTQSLLPIGGESIPSFGGALSSREAGEDWSVWPDARVGDVIRVVRFDGWRDYAGFGPFGDGSFSPEQKGLRNEQIVGSATVVAVNQGEVSLDSPLPAGDRAYLGESLAGFADGEPLVALAGAPGAAFARVLVDAEGAEQVPHHRAVDVVVDNRLQPGQSWVSLHRFESGCEAPIASAQLSYRAAPLQVARERRWDVDETVIAVGVR